MGFAIFLNFSVKVCCIFVNRTNFCLYIKFSDLHCAMFGVKRNNKRKGNDFQVPGPSKTSRWRYKRKLNDKFRNDFERFSKRMFNMCVLRCVMFKIVNELLEIDVETMEPDVSESGNESGNH